MCATASVFAYNEALIVEPGFVIGTDIAQWGVIVTFLVGITTLFLNIRRRDRERDHERGRPH